MIWRASYLILIPICDYKPVEPILNRPVNVLDKYAVELGNVL